ncbi:MAG: type VI secretion system baseplate subunit TssK [Acidobacteria bacterium]|nr:type VI secretion system baseplate subunit TssK [Acidobacteriota bacterium]
MSPYRKIVWNEGMLLSPHHFQQWDNYHEEQLNSRLASTLPYEWGVLDLQLNTDSIANGLVELTICRAVMSDGLLLNIPDGDPAPAPRPVEGRFKPETNRLGVYLAIPAKAAGTVSFQTNGGERGQMVRYWQEVGTMTDETTGQNEQQIAFARSNLRLLFADELRDGYRSIKIAEIERTSATGQLMVSKHYVPPALNAAASAWLVESLDQIVGRLIAKSSSLAEQRRHRTDSLADFTTSEIPVFWLLHTVNSAIPVLGHLNRLSSGTHRRVVHPERLYAELARLAGQLMTFAVKSRPDDSVHPKDIVQYEHENLYFTFHWLFEKIKDLLERVIPTRYVQIPLEKTRDSVYVGRVADERLLAEAAFYLGIHAQIPEGRLIERAPRLIKVASRDDIDGVIGGMEPGLTMTHASPPPAPIPTRAGFHYFALDKFGDLWDAIDGSKTIAVHVPMEFTDEKVELFAVKP